MLLAVPLTLEVPNINTASPSLLKPIVVLWATFSIYPSAPTTGVGKIALPRVSLYKLTLPLTTGTFKTWQALAIPLIAHSSSNTLQV